jgi:hypothetical protein
VVVGTDMLDIGEDEAVPNITFRTSLPVHPAMVLEKDALWLKDVGSTLPMPYGHLVRALHTLDAVIRTRDEGF